MVIGRPTVGHLPLIMFGDGFWAEIWEMEKDLNNKTYKIQFKPEEWLRKHLMQEEQITGKKIFDSENVGQTITWKYPIDQIHPLNTNPSTIRFISFRTMDNKESNLSNLDVKQKEEIERLREQEESLRTQIGALQDELRFERDNTYAAIEKAMDYVNLVKKKGAYNTNLEDMPHSGGPREYERREE